ncbi:MAG: 50S ribosomal protein L10 [Chloroflexi bacterium]|nr:50S ribosomal protein L10 [Chloroflexota bacterium]
MPTQKKIDLVRELRDRIERCAIAVAADFRGLPVTEMVQLRRIMHEAGVEMRVVKNRLFLIAAKEANRPEMAELVDGPTAVIFSYDDVTAPARAVMEYVRSSRNEFPMRKGVLDGQVLSSADLRELADLPPREILIGLVAGALQAPIAGLAGLLNAMLANPAGRLLNDSVNTFAGLLESRAKQLEEGA